MSEYSMDLLPKIFVVLLLLGILASLGSGMVYLVRDRSDSQRTAKALTVRILLSIFLFGLLMLGVFTGVIQPHGIYPNQ
jgi:succinate dehydrogenase hydrophobic anchor subunit